MDQRSLVHFAAGALGGITGKVLTCPLEVVKTRLQSSENISGKNFSLFAKIIREEGFRAMYKGLVPNLISVAPTKAVFFSTYSTCKRVLNNSSLLKPDTSFVHTLSAGFGGFVTISALNPLWMIRTRQQLNHGSLSVRGCIRKIYKNEGISGFYKGITACYLGISESIVQLVLYEQFKALLNDLQLSNPNTQFVNYMFAGGFSKLCACLLTYPHEIVMTRLREENSQAKGCFKTLAQLYRDGGLKILYRGIGIQLMRTVPNGAITLGVYELVVHLSHAGH